MTIRLAVLSGSNRAGSLNTQLAEVVARAGKDRGFDVDTIDLALDPLPLYDPDLEERDGVPEAAHRLAARLDSADAIFIASPEYNGAFTPLLKNTIDWITRSDKTVFARAAVALGSATPGRLGGVNGLGVLRSMLEHMQVPVATAQLSVPRAPDALSDGRLQRPDLRAELTAMLDELEEMVSDTARPEHFRAA